MTKDSSSKSNNSVGKRALLKALLDGQEGDRSNPLTITPREESGPELLSSAQLRLWLLYQLESEKGMYNVPISYRLIGQLDVGALGESLNQVVVRHEVLRTHFALVDGEPRQVVQKELILPLPVVDLSDLPATDRETKMKKMLVAAGREPFDLQTGPLLRTVLFKLEDDHHVWMLCIHHTIFDEWSQEILFRELGEFYRAQLNDLPASLPELPIQYSDFTAWHRKWLGEGVMEDQLAYWREKLSGAPETLDLPTDHPRPATQSFKGAKLSRELPGELRDSLRRFSQKERVTFFTLLLAAFQVFLYRITGQGDVLVGTPIANRRQVEVSNLIGFFLNTLVIRSDLRGVPTFLDVLRQVHESMLEAFDNQDLPFERMVEELVQGRELSHQPLFQVMFVFHPASLENASLPGLDISPVRFDLGTSKFDLTLFVNDTVDGLKARMEYNTDLFERGTIERFLAYYETLLQGILLDPNQSIGSLPILDDGERHQILVEWNQTASEYPREVCLHQLFEAQARQTPEAVAVAFGDQQLTYTALNARANRLAHYLLERGVGANVPVGLCVDRSLDAMVGLLAILKAGGCCLPLDPAYPSARLEFMLRDAAPPVLLTQSGLLEKLPEYDAHIFCLNADWGRLSAYNAHDPDHAVSPDDLLYVLYTSGSTGWPKGAQMPHRALVNLIWWQLENSVLVEGERTLQFASLNFDASFQEIFATWCSGGTLVLISEEGRRDLEGLLKTIHERSIARIFMPFAVLQALADAAHRLGIYPHSLREVITAGEQLFITAEVSGLLDRIPGCLLVNEYGPTEAHVVTAYRLRGEPEEWVTAPPIGKPIANVQVYVLDRQMDPAPVGVPGEIYLGGVCLARGYLDRPELTAEKFVPDPFAGPGARLYRTGDLARYLPDGNIAFLGRMDDQVKIRGYRVELGEIEVTLGEHPNVERIVVLAREDASDGGEAFKGMNRQLVAYVQPRQAEELDVNELRQFLKARLPDYMLPAHFMILDQIPLTPNGKIDRQALPAPERSRSESVGSFVQPRTDTERVLVDIWAEVLSLDRVGVNDDFFELGGHSLLATKLVSRIRRAFQLELPLRAVFERPTVAEMALFVEELVLENIQSMSEEEAAQRLKGPSGGE